MTELDEVGTNLLALLVLQLNTAIPGSPNTYIGYKECHDLLGLQKLRERWGESLKPQGLNSLAEWTVTNNLPAITGLIIDKTTKEPGNGYFSLFGIQTNPYSWWENEIRKSKTFNWAIHTDEDFNLVPIDLNVPDREDIVISRIIRDTALSQLVKRLNSYSCQVCGLSIEMPQGKKYAEAHHIKPLGGPHNGPDVIENMICVCPNHHAMLDYGAIRIDLKQLCRSEGHNISSEFVEYHNAKIFQP